MGIEVKLPDLKGVLPETDQVLELVDRTIQAEVTHLKERTQAGRSYEGRAYKKYSVKYAEVRRKSGRNVTSDFLRYTGDLMRSIQSKVERVGKEIVATIFIADKRQEQKARANEETRPFFGLDREQKDRIYNLITRAFNGRK